jgi:hypothetical protein
LRSWLIAAVVVVAALREGAASRAFAAACGDGVGPCACGDAVVTSTTLGPADPILKTACPCDGLFVGPGVTLEIIGTIRAEAGNLCSGIRLFEADGAAVRTGRIAGFDIGVSVEGVTGARIAKLTISGGSFGIRFEGDDGLVERNIVVGSSTGLDVVGARNEIRLNRTAKTEFQGMLVAGEENVVSRNLVEESGFDGLTIFGDRATVDRNKARLNAGSGFFVDGQGHTVTVNISEFIRDREQLLAQPQHRQHRLRHPGLRRRQHVREEPLHQERARQFSPESVLLRGPRAGRRRPT